MLGKQKGEKRKKKGGGIYHGIVPKIKRVLFFKKGGEVFIMG